MRNFNSWACSGLILCLAAMPGSALAQTAAPAAPAEASDATDENDQEIVVTAQKREQTLIDIPQSITVVGEKALERNQATNFQDYLKLVPGLQLNQSTPGQGRLVLRGVNTGGVASTVAVYVDETTFGSSSGLVNGAILAGDFDTFDVARIEVLRGPQGTLYGASSLGGVLKFVTNKPQTSSVEARARATVETVDGGEISYFGSAMVNVPLGDTIAVRASGFYRNIGGFVDSIGTGGSDLAKNLNDSLSYGGRASLLFEPTDRISLRFSAYLQNLKSDASNSVDSDPVTSKTLYGRLSQSQFVPEFTDVKYNVYNATGTFNLGFADLVSVTSHGTLNQRFRSDLTPQFGGLIELFFGVENDFLNNQTTRVKRFSQEVRLASPSNKKFEWLVGGYYTNEKGLIDQKFDAVAPGTLTPIGGLPLLGVAVLDSKYREYAGFANATVYFGDHFDLTFGGRYSMNKQVADQRSDGALAGGPTALLGNRSSENVFTYSIAPKYKINDRVSLYGRIAKGFRPGGPNVLPAGTPPGTPASYDSDSLTSYEIGLKAQSADRRFTLDVAAFHIDWSNIQLFAVVNGFGVNVNAGGANSSGVEFTATMRPVTGLNLSVNGAYTNAELTDDAPATVGGRDGDRLPFTPKFSGAINADYDWSIGTGKTAYVGGSLRVLSRQSADFDPGFVATFDRQRKLPAYEILDLRAGVDFGRYSIEAFAKNLTNSEGKTSATAGNTPLGAISTGIIRPRSFGLTLTAGL